LKRRGIDSAALAAPLAVVRSADGRGIGLKMPVAGSLDGGELYVRGARPLAEVATFLRERGAGPPVTDVLHDVGHALDRDHAYMVAANVGLDPKFSVIFTQYLIRGDPVLDRLRVAATLVGIGPDQRSTMCGVHSTLGINRPRTLFCSVVCGLNAVEPLFKLDYSDVNLGTLMRSIDAGFDMIHLSRWGAVLDARRADQAGLVFARSGLGLRVYIRVRDA